MTSTISDLVKHKLQINAFDDDFLIITQLIAIYALREDVEFIRLTKKYYTLRFEDFDFITSYLIQIKTLEERIRDIKVTLDDDKQTLLYLDMTLFEKFQYLTKI